MPNIQFNYRYRCSGNYKKFISVVFVNPDGVKLPDLENLIQSKLIYGDYFYAADWRLPEVFTDIVDFGIDPTWHEFESIGYTDDVSNTALNLEEFIAAIEKTRYIY